MFGIVGIAFNALEIPFHSLSQQRQNTEITKFLFMVHQFTDFVSFLMCVLVLIGQMELMNMYQLSGTNPLAAVAQVIFQYLLSDMYVVFNFLLT